MKRTIIILCIAFFLLLISMLVPRGSMVISENTVRTDFGWPIQSLSVYTAEKLESPRALFSSNIGLSDITLNFGTLMSYSVMALLLMALDKGSRKLKEAGMERKLL